MEAFIHSIDTFGTVDGPGIRMVVFLQGCPLRCQYCHNPDTWEFSKSNKMSSEELIKKYLSCRAFLKNGGITVTGGEPLSQIDFVIDFFKKCKEKDIHTCIDTSGITFNKNDTSKFDELMKYTDLVMLDIKHIDDQEHIKLTGQSNKRIIDFALYLREIKKDVWIRHVVVPGITLNDDYLYKLGYFLAELKNIKALDILPYHSMGNEKYTELGMEIPLLSVKDATQKEAENAKNIIMKGLKDRLRNKL